ncbi:MAG: hypothetical protein AAF657_05750 [Acidobacteriota bacterium]
MPEPRDEFYTGYLPTAPEGIARRVRQVVILLFVLTGVVALVLLAGQGGFSAGIYEFGVERAFTGVVREEPYPMLAMQRPGQSAEEPTSQIYLVAPGKFDASDDVAGLDGQEVELKGSLLYRDDQTMVEVVPGSVKPAGAGTVASEEQSLGTQTLIGRIVDSKCYLGIMKPGSTKPHRACATLCIAGGIPPLFLVSDAQGPAAQLLLVGPDGGSVNQEVLPYVDEPLEITGEVLRLDDLWLLKADPASYRRLSGS